MSKCDGRIPEGPGVMVELVEVCCALPDVHEKRNGVGYHVISWLSRDRSPAKEFALPSTCLATNQKSN